MADLCAPSKNFKHGWRQRVDGEQCAGESGTSWFAVIVLNRRVQDIRSVALALLSLSRHALNRHGQGSALPDERKGRFATRAGKSDKAIACEIGGTQQRVGVQRKRLIEKLQIQSQAQPRDIGGSVSGVACTTRKRDIIWERDGGKDGPQPPSACARHVSILILIGTDPIAVRIVAVVISAVSAVSAISRCRDCVPK